MFQDFLTLLFPGTCALCDQGLSRGEDLICLKCIHQFPRYQNDLNRDEIYLHFIESYRYEGFYAYLKFYKKGITQKLLHQIKYNRMPVLGEKIGYLFGLEMMGINGALKIDLVVPVPLHRRKKKKRGYNQSDFFARGLAKGLGTRWSDTEIRRTVNNETQTDKSRQERIENVAGIFSVVRHENLLNKHILLVDDVITTGATLESCAAAILDAVSCRISLAALAVAK
ncbi:MAG: ComF family protein [Cyclobacteriaceae bacterium]|nr:ComF family protein [Cyclobacteriaceae bacterium]